MGSVLKGLHTVRWHELQGALGSAREIPGLLSRAAWGDGPSSRDAIDRLKDHVCELGFVVREATAPTIPFLVELAEAPHVRCKPEIVDLLLSITLSSQWSNTAAALPPNRITHYEEPLRWERACRTATLNALPALHRLASSSEPDTAQPAARIIRFLTEPDTSGHRPI
ncbi:hypothetical protein ACIA8O_01050 [Kitasatospora sp. NPDC051853]|uniref:hypothetical protein n=1 Tax=Kitasatospora sp. NPDC051853 TaxID=3364058 RepID=UPI0037952B3D